MIEIKRLESSEFGILPKIHDGFRPDPKSSVVIVAEDGGKIIGRAFLLAPVHLEGPWINPRWRNGTLAGRMFDAIKTEAKAMGITQLFAYGASKQLEGYLERLEFTRKPLTVWVKAI